MDAVHASNRDGIEELADRLEADLGLLEVCWSAVPDEQRTAVIGRIGSAAPGVARLLCPDFQRFSVPPTRTARSF